MIKKWIFTITDLKKNWFQTFQELKLISFYLNNLGNSEYLMVNIMWKRCQFLLYVLFLAPSTSLRVNSKRTKKTPGCIIDFFHYFFRSLIFARLRCAKIFAKRKKVEPEINKARPDLRFYLSVATNKRGADSGECFF